MNSIGSSCCYNNSFVSRDRNYPAIVSIALGVIGIAGIAVGVIGICSYLPSYSIGIGFSVSFITTAILLAQCCARKTAASSNAVIGLQPRFNIESKSYSQPVKIVLNRQALSSQQNPPENTDEFTSIEKELLDRTTSEERFLKICESLSYKEKMELLDRYYKIIISVICKDEGITYSTHKCFKERFVELILTKEDLEKSDEFGRTLLLNICLRNDFYMASLLVKKGANPNVTDKDGQNVFHLIAHHLVKQQVTDEPIYLFELSKRKYFNWQPQLVSFLTLCVSEGLDVNHRDNNGETFIDIIIKMTPCCKCSSLLERKCSTIDLQVEMLKLWGADFYGKDPKTGKTPLHYACQTGNIHLIELVIKVLGMPPANFDWGDEDGNTPLHLFFASKKPLPHFNFFSNFLKLHPQIYRLQNKKGQTCLHVIIEGGCSDKYLNQFSLEGASSLKDNQGFTALELACLLDDSYALKAFYDTLAPNQLEKLYPFAIKNKKHSVIFDLIDHRAPLKGAYYLSQALEVGHVPTIALLIHFRALQDVEFVYDEQLQNLAKKNDGLHEELLKVCQKNNEKLVFQSFFEAARLGNENGVKFYLDAGFDPGKFRAEHGNTILHLAAMTCQPNIIKACAKFISMDVKNHKNETALHLIPTDKDSNAKKIEETIDALITSKANPNIENQDGYTPIEFYALFDNKTALKALLKHQGVKIERTKESTNPSAFHIAVTNGSVECATLLYENKADINLLFLGDTPLHIAAACGHIDLLLKLIKWGANISIVDNDHKFYWHYITEENALDEFKQLLQQKELMSAASQINKARRPNDFLSTFVPKDISYLIFNYLPEGVSPQRVNKNWHALWNNKKLDKLSLLLNHADTEVSTTWNCIGNGLKEFNEIMTDLEQRYSFYTKDWSVSLYEDRTAIFKTLKILMSLLKAKNTTVTKDPNLDDLSKTIKDKQQFIKNLLELSTVKNEKEKETVEKIVGYLSLKKELLCLYIRKLYSLTGNSVYYKDPL